MSGAAKVRGQCTIEGCTKPHEARGWCKMHYTRWTRSGSTDPGPKANLPLADRFRRFFEPKPLTDGSCWIWQRNMQEAKQRGRLPSRVGKYCKVTYQQVEEIRARAAAGERYASIARSFGLNKQYVGRLVQRTHRVSV